MDGGRGHGAEGSLPPFSCNGLTMVSVADGKPMGSRWEGEADRKQKSLRIARVDPIARPAALLLGQQHGLEAELINH
jgi:hypothetical protein